MVSIKEISNYATCSSNNWVTLRWQPKSLMKMPMPVAEHNRNLIFSNIEEPYDKLPKYLNSAITNLFYCFSRGERALKMKETQKLQKFQILFYF